MRGIPKNLNTKDDVENCLEAVLAGELDGTVLKKQLLNLLSTETVWEFKVEVTEAYIPKTDEQVLKQTDNATGMAKHVCYVLVNNPTAAYLLMGYSRDELQSIINQL